MILDIKPEYILMVETTVTIGFITERKGSAKVLNWYGDFDEDKNNLDKLAKKLNLNNEYSYDLFGVNGVIYLGSLLDYSEVLKIIENLL